MKAACDARASDEFVIIAQTDALAVTGWDDVIIAALALFTGAGAALYIAAGLLIPGIR